LSQALYIDLDNFVAAYSWKQESFEQPAEEHVTTKIVTASGESTWTLAASSSAERDAWLAALQSAVDSSAATDDESSDELAALATRMACSIEVYICIASTASVLSLMCGLVQCAVCMYSSYSRPTLSPCSH
jgi:hypothetical protein